MLTELTDETFDRVVMQSDKPSVILFTSGWCTLCEDMIPLMQAASTTYSGHASFFTCNVDENKALRIKFAVAALPTVVYVSDGSTTMLFDSITTPEAFYERIEYMLTGGQAPNTRALR